MFPMRGARRAPWVLTALALAAVVANGGHGLAEATFGGGHGRDEREDACGPSTICVTGSSLSTVLYVTNKLRDLVPCGACVEHASSLLKCKHEVLTHRSGSSAALVIDDEWWPKGAASLRRVGVPVGLLLLEASDEQEADVKRSDGPLPDPYFVFPTRRTLKGALPAVADAMCDALHGRKRKPVPPSRSPKPSRSPTPSATPPADIAFDADKPPEFNLEVLRIQLRTLTVDELGDDTRYLADLIFDGPKPPRPKTDYDPRSPPPPRYYSPLPSSPPRYHTPPRRGGEPYRPPPSDGDRSRCGVCKWSPQWRNLIPNWAHKASSTHASSSTAVARAHQHASAPHRLGWEPDAHAAFAIRQVVQRCGRANCAARVTILSNRFIRREIISRAMRILRRRPDFSDVFQPSRIRIRRVGGRTFVVIVNFRNDYLQEF